MWGLLRGSSWTILPRHGNASSQSRHDQMTLLHRSEGRVQVIVHPGSRSPHRPRAEANFAACRHHGRRPLTFNGTASLFPFLWDSQAFSRLPNLRLPAGGCSVTENIIISGVEAGRDAGAFCEALTSR